MQQDSNKIQKVDLSTKIAFVYDNGLFTSFASKLGESFKKVYYFTEWVAGFPKMNEALIGKNWDNIERVDNLWDYLDETDIFIFPDVYNSELQLHLESLGKLVWGSRRGDELELYRDQCKKIMKKQGLPVGPYEVVKGMDALREYLKENKDIWVKINGMRGTFETFQSKHYKLVEPKLDEVEYALGAFKNETKFVCEADLPDKVEIGYDGYCIDGEYPSKNLTGIEIKDLGYAGIFKEYKDLPVEITEYNTKMAPIFKKYGYRNFMSTELRVGKDKKSFMIDQCSRLGSPPNELYVEFYKNLAEIIWHGANGVVIDPIPAAKWGVEVLIHSAWADKNWQPIDYPKSIRQWVKLRYATKIEGRDYIIPQAVGLPEVGAVIGIGATLEEAIEMVKSNAEQIEGYYVTIPISSMDDVKEQIDKTESFGIKLFS